MAAIAPDILTRRKSKRDLVLLPYQVRWERDASRFRIWEKSRRIGADYVAAHEACMTRLDGSRPWDLLYSSSDESGALEFSDYVKFFCDRFDAVAQHYSEDVETFDERPGTAFVTKFPEAGGAKILCMSSSPRRFRSKGGDVVISELAHHDHSEALWRACSPCVTWGFRISVLIWQR